MENNDLSSNGLDTVIKESKDVLNAEVEKKTRGRPKKDGTTSPKAKTAPTNHLGPVMQPMSKDVYKQTLGGALNLINLYLNKYTNSDVFNLTKEEMDMITETGSTSMMDFMPSIDPRYLNAIAFTCVLGGVYGMKYQAYVDMVTAENKKRLAEKPTEVKP